MITDANLFIHKAVDKAGSKEKLGKELNVSRWTIAKWQGDPGSIPFRAVITICYRFATLKDVLKCAKSLYLGN